MIKLYFVAILSILMSCTGSKSIVSDNFEIELKEGACFGSCPVFTLVIDNEGMASYDGVRFTDLIGKYTLQLSVDKVKELNSEFEKSNFENFKDEYISQIADLPTVSIRYINNDIDKLVVGKENRPDQVIALQEMLENIVSHDGWRKVKDTSAIEEIVVVEEEPIIENEFIIQFEKGTPLSRWIQGYKQYRLSVKEPLSDDKWLWLVQFDKNSIDPKEMLILLQSDENIESVEFNKPN